MNHLCFEHGNQLWSVDLCLIGRSHATTKNILDIDGSILVINSRCTILTWNIQYVFKGQCVRPNDLLENILILYSREMTTYHTEIKPIKIQFQR